MITRLTFFYLKFDHPSYSKNLCKYSQIYVILEELLLMKQATIKRSDILQKLGKLGIKKIKRLII
jgi:hypothetical protein